MIDIKRNGGVQIANLIDSNTDDFFEWAKSIPEVFSASSDSKITLNVVWPETFKNLEPSEEAFAEATRRIQEEGRLEWDWVINEDGTATVDIEGKSPFELEVFKVMLLVAFNEMEEGNTE